MRENCFCIRNRILTFSVIDYYYEYEFELAIIFYNETKNYKKTPLFCYFRGFSHISHFTKSC